MEIKLNKLINIVFWVRTFGECKNVYFVQLGMSWGISRGEMHLLSIRISTNIKRKYKYYL